MARTEEPRGLRVYGAVEGGQPAAIAIWSETTDTIDPPIHEWFGHRAVAHLDVAAWLPGPWVSRHEPSNLELSA